MYCLTCTSCTIKLYNIGLATGFSLALLFPSHVLSNRACPQSGVSADACRAVNDHRVRRCVSTAFGRACPPSSLARPASSVGHVRYVLRSCLYPPRAVFVDVSALFGQARSCVTSAISRACPPLLRVHPCASRLQFMSSIFCVYICALIARSVQVRLAPLSGGWRGGGGGANCRPPPLTPL